MANLANISVESAYQQFGVFAGLDFQGSSGNYIHMETNVPILSSVMMMIEAVGYNYGVGLPIRCAWNFYAYGGGSFGNSNNGAYGGLSANGQYDSGQNYLTIRAYSSSLHYCGFTLNAYPLAGTGPFSLSIRRVSQNSTSGNYY